MANFVRDGVALEIPEAQLSLLKMCFDKADDKITKLQSQLDSLTTLTIDGKKYLADSVVIAELDKVQKDSSQYQEKYTVDAAEVEALNAELTVHKKLIDEFKAKEEALTKEIESLQAQSSESVIADRVAERRKLERQVFPLLDSAEEKLEVMSDRQLKEAVIADRYGESIEGLSTRTDEAINAMFEIACKHSLNDSAKNKTTLPQAVTQDSASEVEKARQEYIESIQNAHKLLFK